MTMPLLEDSMNALEEYRFLRQELDMNRKYVFERPLLIVGATFAGAISLTEKGRLGMLPLPFLAVLLFNLWFTVNRLQSSARIVAYIQLVHESANDVKLVGWENALRKYREWIVQNTEELNEVLQSEKDIRQYASMVYYPPIYYFHLFIGLIVTLVLISQSDALSKLISPAAQATDLIWVCVNCLFLITYSLTFIWFRPGKVKHSIEMKRRIWEKVLASCTAQERASLV